MAGEDEAYKEYTPSNIYNPGTPSNPKKTNVRTDSEKASAGLGGGESSQGLKDLAEEFSGGVKDRYVGSGKQVGAAGYYEYVNTYWDRKSGDDVTGKPRSVSGPQFGDYGPDDYYQESDIQSVWQNGGYNMLNPYQQSVLRDATYSNFGYEASPINFDSTLDKALRISHFSAENGGEIITVEQALRDMIDPEKLAELGRGKGSGSGRAAPVAPDATQIRRIMDATSSSLIGRTLSDKEFNKYYKQYLGEFNANPNIDTQQALTERVRKEEDYQEMQVASKFSNAMSQVMKGAI